MANRTCSIDNCGKKHFGRGYCSGHYYKWNKYGDPLAGAVQYATPEESFAARTSFKGECLVWTAALSNGYGVISVGNDDQMLAHRYAWERANGPIPDGLFIDHRCHNRACVTVEHLRLATSKQNNENRGTLRNTASGVRGVVWDKARGKWKVHITHLGKTINFGRFDNLAEATDVAERARLQYFTYNDHDRAA
jgi:hypothetical protein